MHGCFPSKDSNHISCSNFKYVATSDLYFPNVPATATTLLYLFSNIFTNSFLPNFPLATSRLRLPSVAKHQVGLGIASTSIVISK